MSRIQLLILAMLLLVATSATAQPGNNTPVLNPNTATAEQMAALPGMNAKLADVLVSGRPYLSMKTLDEVLADHLDRKSRQALYERMFLPIDLNTARASEIRLVPGMSRKMVHEFEEYRPYTSMEQFHREIGKYVDDDEVARLARYVTIGED